MKIPWQELKTLHPEVATSLQFVADWRRYNGYVGTDRWTPQMKNHVEVLKQAGLYQIADFRTSPNDKAQPRASSPVG